MDTNKIMENSEKSVMDLRKSRVANDKKKQEDADQLTEEQWKERDEIEQMLCKKMGIKDGAHLSPEERRKAWDSHIRLTSRTYDKGSPLEKSRVEQLSRTELELKLQQLIDRVLALREQSILTGEPMDTFVEQVCFEEKKKEKEIEEHMKQIMAPYRRNRGRLLPPRKGPVPLLGTAKKSKLQKSSVARVSIVGAERNK